jgi:hypothetical protein
MDEVKLLESLSSIFGNPEGSENAVNELKVKKQEREFLEHFKNILGKKSDQLEEIAEQLDLTEQNVITEDLPPFQAVAPLPVLPVDFVTAAARSIRPSTREPNNNSPESLVRKELDSIKKSILDLHAFASQMSNMGGGGEVNLAFMDMNKKTITNSSYTITQSDYYIGVNYAGAVTLTLPTNCKEGKVFIIKDELGQAGQGVNRYITINASGTNTIDGQTSVILAYDFGSLTFLNNNGNWSIV